ncbi:MAG: hypothetical protein JWP25_6609 [Bradyrhizobium sp.]|nr:hypothetical protein [Bradyrhizobium sp.]
MNPAPNARSRAIDNAMGAHKRGMQHCLYTSRAPGCRFTVSFKKSLSRESRRLIRASPAIVGHARVATFLLVTTQVKTVIVRPS